MIGTATLFARSVAAVCLYRQDMVLGRFNVSRHGMACALRSSRGGGGGSDGSDDGSGGGGVCSVLVLLGIDTSSVHEKQW